ncbi:hypothetical protein A2U01_0009684 [Trifolium medium]|uniref:Uncharacterized protein n=1 Tax=Trifolium medium TaxID=97028 RepID=A0A392MN39_9FABA|nr:hypothetical protein [Trifolium medium]
MLASMVHGWKNAIAQLKIVNAEHGLITDGIHKLKRVENGQIVIPEEYKEMELEEEKLDEEEGDDEDEEDEEVEEEVVGEERAPEGNPEELFSEANTDADTLLCPPPRLELPIASWALSLGTKTRSLSQRSSSSGRRSALPEPEYLLFSYWIEHVCPRALRCRGVGLVARGSEQPFRSVF